MELIAPVTMMAEHHNSAITPPKNHSTLFWAALAAALVSCFVAAPALAETRSATMSVSAVVEDACSVSATPMAFEGTNGTGVANGEGTAQISVQCASSSAFIVDMDRGVNAAGVQRRMVSEDGTYLDYQIFSDASRTTEWRGGGEGVPSQSPGATRASMTAYGRIEAISSEARSGIYRDTVTVTVNF